MLTVSTIGSLHLNLADSVCGQKKDHDPYLSPITPPPPSPYPMDVMGGGGGNFMPYMLDSELANPLFDLFGDTDWLKFCGQR